MPPLPPPNTPHTSGHMHARTALTARVVVAGCACHAATTRAVTRAPARTRHVSSRSSALRGDASGTLLAPGQWINSRSWRTATGGTGCRQLLAGGSSRCSGVVSWLGTRAGPRWTGGGCSLTGGPPYDGRQPGAQPPHHIVHAQALQDLVRGRRGLVRPHLVRADLRGAGCPPGGRGAGARGQA